MKVLLTGGGTGGHIYPALAVARRLKALHEDVEILYVGTERGLESKSVPEAGFAFEAIEMEGFRRKLNWKNIKYNFRSLYLFMAGINRSRKLIKKFQPDIVLGTGGYVSAPVCFAASLEKIPTVIHEQNSILGLTNKFLVHFVNKICICFPSIYDELKKHAKKIEFTGNPRAQEVVEQTDEHPVTIPELAAYDPEKETVLIVGGSRGAQPINEAFVEAYHLFADSDYQVIFVTGAAHFDEVSTSLSKIQQLKNNEQIFVVPYIADMVNILPQIDLMVTRSGATTIAEITALGLPAILIPSPYVTADHQTKNASSLVENGAAIQLAEKELTGFALYQQVNQLMTDVAKRQQMSTAAKTLGRPDATDRVIQVMMNEIKNEEG